MSALNFARQAFGREKPRSSITDWVEILTSASIEEEAYDGIPELVDSINLQPTGPAEASRALRKKLKHGSPHQQYRALVLLKALVENCGHKFQTTFADGHLTDALKQIANDSQTDRRVKKKLILVLTSWRDQFKSDPSMSLVAGLLKQCRGTGQRLSQADLTTLAGLHGVSEDKKKNEKEELKKKAKQEKEAKERARRELEAQRSVKTKRVPFNFEKDKPKVLASIVDASQASSNLVNSITLVNPEVDSLLTNERVQDCLQKAKQAAKVVVRYIQLVENEELIGTLIETNERIVAALEMYDKLSTTDPSSDADISRAITSGLAAANITDEGEVAKLQGKQRAAVAKAQLTKDNPVRLYPDLEDLNFGPLGASSTNLPPPIRPSALSDDGEQDDIEKRGSLSDFSDYESSDEETHKAVAGPSSKRNYVTVSDDDDEFAAIAREAASTTSGVADDPFADPFADDTESRTYRR